jgi:hypothetical protein
MSTPRAARSRDLGPAAQALVPGLYAWALTVAPLAWGRGATTIARGAALLPPLGLVAALLLERRRPGVARALSLWPLVVGAALVWLLSPPQAFTDRLDTVPTLLGMLGWALFALTAGAPMPSRDADLSQRIVAGAPLQPRTVVPGGGRIWLAGGVLLAASLQVLVPENQSVERALLHRLLATLCGIGLLGGVSVLGSGIPATPSGPSPLRNVLPHALLLLTLALVVALIPR